MVPSSLIYDTTFVLTAYLKTASDMYFAGRLEKSGVTKREFPEGIISPASFGLNPVILSRTTSAT